MNTSRSAWRGLAAVVLLAQLAGCGTMGKVEDWWKGDAADKPAPLPQFTAKAEARALWQASVGAANDYAFSPAQQGGSVYAAGHDGAIVRLDAATGRQTWRIDAGQKLTGGVGAAPGMVLVGTGKGKVLAFDEAGKPLWQAQVSSEVLSAPQSDGATVVVRGGDGRIFGLDARDGKRKWLYQRATPALSVRSFAGALIERGAVFAGFPGGKLVALELNNGNVGWEASVAMPRGATELERIADITSVPAADTRYLYSVAYQGRVAALDPVSGNVVWARDASSYTGLAVDGRNVYVADAKGAVLAMDKGSGASVWKQDKLAGRQLSAPVVYSNYVAVGDYEGYIHFLSREDGSFVARVATDGSAVRVQPLAEDNYLLVQTVKGGVYAVAVK